MDDTTYTQLKSLRNSIDTQIETEYVCRAGVDLSDLFTQDDWYKHFDWEVKDDSDVDHLAFKLKPKDQIVWNRWWHLYHSKCVEKTTDALEKLGLTCSCWGGNSTAMYIRWEFMTNDATVTTRFTSLIRWGKLPIVNREVFYEMVSERKRQFAAALASLCCLDEL